MDRRPFGQNIAHSAKNIAHSAGNIAHSAGIVAHSAEKINENRPFGGKVHSAKSVAPLARNAKFPIAHSAKSSESFKTVVFLRSAAGCNLL